MDLVDLLPKGALWLHTAEGRAQLFLHAQRHRWTEQENEILQRFYPNSDKLSELLPRRTKKSRYHQARCLGLVKTVYRWSEAEIKWLKRNYGTATHDEIRRFLPRRTIRAVYRMAGALRLDRERSDPPLIGVYILDEIRARAKELNFSLKDLDEEAGLIVYFQKNRIGKRPVYIRISAVEAALKAMGGQIEIRWSDQ